MTTLVVRRKEELPGSTGPPTVNPAMNLIRISFLNLARTGPDRLARPPRRVESCVPALSVWSDRLMADIVFPTPELISLPLTVLLQMQYASIRPYNSLS